MAQLDELLFNILSILAYLLISLLVAILVLIYFTRKSRFYWYSYVVLGWTYWIGFFSMALLSIDIATGLYKVSPSKSVFYILYVLWQVIYWNIQILAWIVIPIAQSLVMSGQFTFWRKLLHSIIENVVLYIVFGVVFGGAGVAIIIYMIVKTQSEGVPISELFKALPAVAIQASNGFGTILLIFFLGFGIVAFPRRFWNKSDHNRRLKYLQFQVFNLQEILDEKEDDFRGILKELRLFSSDISEEDPLRSKVDKLKQEYASYLENLTPTTASDFKPVPRTHKGLVKLNRKCIQTARSFNKTKHEMDEAFKEAFFLQDVLRSKRMRNVKVIETPFKKPYRYLRKVRDTFDYYYYCYIWKYFYRTMAILSLFYGLIILWCEISPTLNLYVKNIDFSLFSLFVRLFSFNRFAIQVVSLLLIISLGTIIYFALFEFKFLKLYHLIPGHSDSPTLLFTAVLLCRLVPAFLFNFLLLLKVQNEPSDGYGIAYFRVAGSLNLERLQIIGKIGLYFSNFYPLLMVVVAFVTIFASTFLSKMGIFCTNIHDFVFDKSKSKEGIEVGSRLIRLERTKQLRVLGKEDLDDELEEEVSGSDIEEEATFNFRPEEVQDELSMDRFNSGDSSDESIDENNFKYSKATQDRLAAIYAKHKKNIR